MALENKLNITDSAELARVEERISKKKAVELFDSKLIDTFEVGTFAGLAAIHKYLFEDIYDFAGEDQTVNIAKECFEPDYVLFLHSDKTDGYEQLQVFIEPKGTHLLGTDKWKEDFLLQLEENAVPVVKFVDDNEYRIWDFHFYNQAARMTDFTSDMEKL